MRILLAAICVLAAAWSGYWYVGYRGVENGLRLWLDQRAEAGWTATYSDLATRGYPNRFDTTINDLEMGLPDTGVTWSAPFFQLFQLSYSPNHVIVVWPESHTITTAGQTITITSASTRGSLVFASGDDLALDHSTFEVDTGSLSSSDGWKIDVSKALLATRLGAQQNAVDLWAEATEMRMGGALLDQITETTPSPGPAEHLRLDATLGFDAPWDRQALNDDLPALTSLTLKQLQLNWGDMDFQASGELQIDPDGIPTGKITIRAKDWTQMLKLAVAIGWVPTGLSGPMETGMGFLASVSGDPETLEAPLKFENGKVAFGPLTLGDAPRLMLK